MEHDVGAELERALDDGRREGAVDQEPRAGVAGNAGERRQVDDLHHRVGRALGPDQARLGADLRGDGVQVAEVGERRCDPEARQALPGDVAKVVIDVVAEDHVRAGR